MAGEADGKVVVDTELDPTGFRAGSEAMKGAVQSLTSKFNSLGSGAEMFGRVWLGTFRLITSEALSFYQISAKLTFRTAVAGAKKLVSTLGTVATLTKRIFTGSKKLGSGFSSAAKQAAGIALGLLGIKGIMSSLTESINAYKDANEELALMQKRIWATTGSFIGPVLEKIVALEAKAVSYLSAFLHYLGFTSKATTTAINKSGKAAKKETKELKRQLASFDELNILSDTSKDKDKDSSSGSNDAVEPLPDAELPQWLKDMADLMKDGKWAEAARILKDELTDLMDSIDWGAAGEKAGKAINGPLEFLKTFAYEFPWDKLGKHLAEFANGLMRTVDWANAGALAVSGFYIALKLLTGFFNELDPHLFSDSIYNFIMGAVNAADWPTLTKDFSKALSDFINGLYWDKLGEAFGALFGTVITSIRSFIETFDWLELGRNLGRGLNSFIENVPWDDLGFLMVAKLYILIQAITGFFQTLDPKLVGDAIYDTIFGGINAADWPRLTGDLFKAISDFIMGLDTEMLGFALGSAMQTILASIHSAIINVDWDGIGAQFALFVNGILNAVNWIELGDTLAAAIKGALEFGAGAILTLDWEALAESFNGFATHLLHGVADAVRGIDWAGVGTSFGEFLKTVDWGGIINGLFDVIKAIGAALLEFLPGFLEGFVSAMFEILGALIGGLAEFLWGIVQAELDALKEWWHAHAYEDGQFTITGLLSGIADALVNIGAWLLENVVTPFLSGLLKAFGLDVEASELYKIGIDLIAGLFNGIKEKMKKISDWLKEHITDPIIGGIKKLFGIHSPATETKALGEDVSEGLKSGMQSKMGTVAKVKSWLKSNITGPIMDGIKGLFGIKNNKASETEAQGKALTEGLHSGIKAPWSSVENTLKGYADKVVKVFKDKEGSMRTTGTNLITQLKSGFASGWSTVPTLLSGYATQVTGAFSAQYSNMGTVGGNLISYLYQGMSSKITELSGHFASLAYSVANAMPSETMKSAMEGPGKWLGYGLYMGIYNYLTENQSNFEALARWVASIFSSELQVSSPSKVFAKIGGFLMEGLSVGMDDEKKSVLQTTSGIASAITDEMETGEFAVNSTLPRALDQFGDLIADKFTDLINRLDSIAGKVTFATPAMANGAVPYSVSASTMDSSLSDQKQNDDLASVLIQVVNNAVITLVRAIEENGGTVVNIDKSSLTQAVIEEINRITRMTGTSPLLV